MTDPPPSAEPPGRIWSHDGAVTRPTGAGATPAATVVPLRDGPGGVEALLLRRQRGGAFSGMWVYPGGKVDAADVAATSGPGSEDPEAARLDAGGAGAYLEEIAVARVAAVREAAEEAALRLAPADLVVHSFWIPPPETPRRFATWFFVADASAADAITVDHAEVHEYRWMRPADAFAARDDGTISLAPPTWMTLWQVGAHPDVAAVLADAAGRAPLRFETRLLAGDGTAAVAWEGDAAYASGDLAAPGGRRRLWITDGAPWRAEVTVTGVPDPGR